MQRKAHGNRDERVASEVFGCIPHGRGAYRESDSFAMWAVHHGVTVLMTTVSISSDPFTPIDGWIDSVGSWCGCRCEETA